MGPLAGTASQPPLYPPDYVNGGEMFTHLYQRQHFKEAEVRVYAGEIVLALEHLHKVGEDLPHACCHGQWPGPSQGPPNRTAAGLALPGPPAALASWWGLLWHLQGAFLSQGTRGCLLGPCSQNFLNPRPWLLKLF